MKQADIVIINYNDKERIERCIKSALNQTWKNTNVIVVDDGSTQDVREIYKQFENDIKLVQLERDDVTSRTPSRARNKGIDHCTGDYICFLDSDNYYNSGFIENLIKFEKDYAFCNWEIVGIAPYKVNIEQVWQGQDILNNYLRFQHLDHQAILFKRSYLDKIGHYDERLPRSQDCDLIARAILNGGEYYHTAKRGFVFEKHEEDQNKQIASIHGKTLWSLKNNISIKWLTPLLNNPYIIMSYYQAINDFINKSEWKIEYNNSEFKTLHESHLELLGIEKSEKIDG